MMAHNSPNRIFDLMFTFDGDDGESLCLGISKPSSFASSKPSSTASSCHQYVPVASILGSQPLLPSNNNSASADEAKTAQLLMQWLALPTTDTLLGLLLSNARRSLPISRDALLASFESCLDETQA